MSDKVYLTEELIEGYSKKIFGFAFNKTGDVYQAEELSQEIFLNLVATFRKGKEIVALDRYIYTLCYYTWSKYVRKNIKSWRDQSTECIWELVDAVNIENDYILQENLEKLRKEIAYLARLQRQITIAFYYENKTSQEIAKNMGIADSTVRWHLTEVRKKLKEGIEMVENLNYSPQKLNVWHDGWVSDLRVSGLKDDLICQNIAIACYDEPLTVEEIGRKLGVAAAYLEKHIQQLVFMDYMKVVGKNKYQTNFYIQKLADKEKISKLQYESIGPLADNIYSLVKKYLERIKVIGFIGHDLPDNELLLMMIAYYTYQIHIDSMIQAMETYHLTKPKRKDGSEHWLGATLLDGEKCEYLQKVLGMGIKTGDAELGIRSLQFDIDATQTLGSGWRTFGRQELNDMYRIRQIILNDEEPNEVDQLIIAKMIRLGYVQRGEGQLKILIPFMTAEEMTALNTLMEEIKVASNKALYEQYLKQVSDARKIDMPSFIGKEEALYHIHSIYPVYAVLFYLVDNGYIDIPSKEQVKHILTLVWLQPDTRR